VKVEHQQLHHHIFATDRNIKISDCFRTDTPQEHQSNDNNIMEVFESHLEKATAKGANVMPGAVMAVVDKDGQFIQP
jgi:pyridoxine/pyridoxamine 5'-phosphate oxidase